MALCRETFPNPNIIHVVEVGQVKTSCLIHSVDEWMEARNLRNRLIHEYMHDPEAFLQALERAEQLVPALLASYELIENYLKERWGERLT